MHVVELGARAFLEQVRIDGVRPQERDTMLPGGMLALDLRQFAGEVGGLLHQVLFGPQSVLARMGMHPEVPDDHRGSYIEADGAHGGAETATADHAVDHDELKMRCSR